MRIAQIASPIESVPPKKYGGIERVIHALTEELVRQGHDVTLFATGDSITSAKLVAPYPRNLRQDLQGEFFKKAQISLYHIALAYQQQQQFDIMHDHTQWFGVPFAQHAITPVVMTLHGALTQETIALYETLSKPYLVSISYAQTRPAPGLNYIANVYNGLDMTLYPFSPRHKGYLLFVGRICQEKGVHHAIAVAEKLGLPLLIAAKLERDKKEHLAYFNRYVKPKLSPTIRWIGEVTEMQRNKLFANALCSLHPVTWPEPFGLTLIEAMSCGCPVIAFDEGSIPEIIQHGRTGFIVHTVDEMITAVQHITTIDRLYCRVYATTTFHAKRMADEYEGVYEAILRSKQFVKRQRMTKNLNHFLSP
ncbi:MAG TPA: glycosyltransferase family 4 protein [Patescibacteria group bacterium]|nr:glycosyltransferase family 4 protein [Patescibacteria group bacterium]